LLVDCTEFQKFQLSVRHPNSSADKTAVLPDRFAADSAPIPPESQPSFVENAPGGVNKFQSIELLPGAGLGSGGIVLTTRGDQFMHRLFDVFLGGGGQTGQR
jgi:hypothetical protein